VRNRTNARCVAEGNWRRQTDTYPRARATRRRRKRSLLRSEHLGVPPDRGRPL